MLAEAGGGNDGQRGGAGPAGRVGCGDGVGGELVGIPGGGPHPPDPGADPPVAVEGYDLLWNDTTDYSADTTRAELLTLLWRQAGATPWTAPNPLPGNWNSIPNSALPAYQWAYRTHVLCDTTVADPTAAVNRHDAGNWIRWARTLVDCNSPGEN